MLVYNYDEITKEYLGSQEADCDYGETKVQGHFVPLVPANATLTAPPEEQTNKARVYNGEWSYIDDYRTNYKKADSSLNIFDISNLGPIEEGFYLVTNAMAEGIESNRSYYKILNGEVVRKSNEEIAAEELAKAKALKIRENDTVRDATINGGVMYKDILFDSDTDQKVNLLAMAPAMSETDVITWYGMNNEGLECTRDDLELIGALIATLHTYCWTRNAQLKGEINAAETVEEVEAIEITYDINGEE